VDPQLEHKSRKKTVLHLKQSGVDQRNILVVLFFETSPLARKNSAGGATAEAKKSLKN